MALTLPFLTEGDLAARTGAGRQVLCDAVRLEGGPPVLFPPSDAAFYGADPLAWMKREAGRIVSLHAKDLAPAGEKLDEDGWADVGTGSLDWPTLARAGRDAGARWLVAEHDKPNDPARFARNSQAFLSTLGG